MSNQKWKLDFESSSTKKEYQLFFEKHPDQRLYKKKFEQDVTSNPYFHPKDRRISKLKGVEFRGLYRWSISNTRVIYYPESPSQIVYVIETGTATKISYKRS